MTSPDRAMRLNAAIAGPDPAQAAFAEAEAMTREDLGGLLFTVTAHDPGASECWRVYTNNADAYPLYGRKPLERDSWFETVIEGKRPFVANTVEAFRALFPDYELIRSLGCESVINIPVIVGGVVIGTVNILDAAGHFTPERVAAAMALQPYYTAALLAALSVEART